MKDWKKAIIGPTASINDAIEVIDKIGLQIALVVDAQGVLKGIATDGDIRRAILKNIPLKNSITEVMNSTPMTLSPNDKRSVVIRKMRQKEFRHLPLIDADGKLVGFELLPDSLRISDDRENWVVLMAGGLGSRLGELTTDVPKPLLHVGFKPILETILVGVAQFGFRNFFISVNYKADMIKEYFGDGSKWGVNIAYLHEETRLGTAGALRLLPEKPKMPVLVMNGDLLTNIDLDHLFAFHEQNKSSATMCIRQYDFQVPFGVVTLKGNQILELEEKPSQNFFVNAGIYILNPESLDVIPSSGMYDMTQLFNEMIKTKKNVTGFPIREYWMDIGQRADLDRANQEISQILLKENMKRGE